MRVVAMSAQYAVAITAWRYPPPYDCYDMTGVDPDFLVQPGSGFFALLDGDELIGFRSFGEDGQVPGWDYDKSALDTGGGLRPDLTGMGLGRQAIQTGLDFGRGRFFPAAFRMTIAAFNQRARRVVGALGFQQAGCFQGFAGDGSGVGPGMSVPVRIMVAKAGRPPWTMERQADMTDHNGVLMMQRLLLAGTLGLAVARKAAAILDGEPAQGSAPQPAQGSAPQAAQGSAPQPAQALPPGPDPQSQDGAVLRAILDAANECLGHFDDRPPGERWCDALLHLLDLAAFAADLGSVTQAG